MTVTPTTDAALIHFIATHPTVWPHISDDGSDAGAYEPTLDPAVWLLVKDEAQVLGTFMLHPLTGVCWQGHVCMLPWAYGKKAKQAFGLMVDWLFTNTDCVKLVGHIPADNQRAIAYAKRCGMVEEGINSASVMRSGNLTDMLYFGLKKEH